MKEKKRERIVPVITGVHALSQMDGKKPLCSRRNGFPFIVFLCAVAGLSLHTYLVLQQFLAVRTVVHTQIHSYEPGKVAYPSVTFCSLNPFKLSKINMSVNMSNIQATYNYGVQKLDKELQQSTRKKRSKKQTVDTDDNNENAVQLRGKRQLAHSYSYLGCYARYGTGSVPAFDTKYSFDDPDVSYVTPNTDPMSVNLCLSMCQNFWYAALTDGDKCICGYTWYGDSNGNTVVGCDTVCEDTAKTDAECTEHVAGCPSCGVGKQCCGGTGEISVYEAGCLYDGDKCGCGNHVDWAPTMVDESECNTPCANGALKADCVNHDCDALTGCGAQSCCGGTDRIAIYLIRGCRAEGMTNYNSTYYSVLHGESIEWSCAEGYELQNDQPAVSHCTSTGYDTYIKDEAPSCLLPTTTTTIATTTTTVSQCTLDSLTISGYLVPSGRNLQGTGSALTVPVGESVSFACDEPELSMLNGSDSITCLPSGWDAPIPSCVEIDFDVNGKLPLSFDIDLLSERQIATFQESMDLFEMTGGNSTYPPQVSHILLVEARRAMQKQMEEVEDEVLEAMSYDAEEFMPACRFDSRQCDFNDFALQHHNIYGHCFTFNLNGSQFAQYSSLEYALHAQFESSDLLYTSDTIGARISINEPGLYPLPDLNGLNVAKGYQYQIRFQKDAVNYLTDCVNTMTSAESKSVYPAQFDYSKETCHRSCVANYVYDVCRCTDGRFPKPANTEAVSACREDNSCYTHARAYSAKHCDCKQTCRFVYYRSTMSSSALLSDRTLKDQAVENSVVVEVLPASSFYEEHTEERLMHISDVYLHISNAVGIWLGLSWIGLSEIIIAVFEFVLLK